MSVSYKAGDIWQLVDEDKIATVVLTGPGDWAEWEAVVTKSSPSCDLVVGELVDLPESSLDEWGIPSVPVTVPALMELAASSIELVDEYRAQKELLAEVITAYANLLALVYAATGCIAL